MNETLKYPTYIEGLDELLGGGIPANHIVMLSGTAGTMKSSLAYAFLYNNAVRSGVKSLYVSLEQTRASLKRHMEGMNFPQDAAEGLVDILDIGIIRRKMQGSGKLWLELFKMYASRLKKANGYRLLVLDSIDVLEMLSKFRDYRLELFNLFKWLRELDVTAVLITEIPHILALAFTEQEDLDIFSRHKEGYLVDGIIHLKMEKRGEFEVERRIRCVKMRGARHSSDYGILSFENKKFQVLRVISG